MRDRSRGEGFVMGSGRSNILFVVFMMLFSVLSPFSLLAATTAQSGQDISPEGQDAASPLIGSRAQLEAWTDTDWSNGNYNTSSDIEVDLTPGKLVLASDINDMVLGANPTLHSHIHSLVEYDGGISIVASTPGSSTNAILYHCLEDGGSTHGCHVVGDIEEDMVYDLSVSEDGTRLYIPGAAPLNISNNGSLYYYNGSNISRFDIKDATTRSTGVLSTAEVGGKIYLTSVDTDNRAYVYRSVDDGNTWFKVNNLGARPYDRTMYSIGVDDGTIYAQPDGLANEGAKIFKFNGTVWKPETIPGLVNGYGAFVNTGSGDDMYLLNGGNLFRYGTSSWGMEQVPFSSLVMEIGSYDHGSGNFTDVGALGIGRLGQSVDLAGDVAVTIGGMVGAHVQTSVETYEVVSGNMSVASSMQTARAYHASTVLQDGSILVSGGMTGLPPAHIATTSTARFNLTSGWTVVSSLGAARANHTATLLDDGRVLVTGGQDGGFLSSSQIFDPQTNSWGPAASMAGARANHVAVLLDNGSVLVAGGRDGTGALDTSEVYVPGTDTWYSLPALPYPAFDLSISKLDNGNALISGGTTDGATGTTSSSVLDTTTDTWSGTMTMGSARFMHTSTAIGNDVVVIGGLTSPGVLPQNSETYSAGTWTPMSSADVQARFGHSTVIYNSSNILVVGGARATFFNGPDTKAAAPAGQDGIVVGLADGTIHLYDGSSITVSSDPIPGNREITDIMVFNGRVHVTTTGPAELLVASAATSGYLVSTPHEFSGHIENATMEWDRTQDQSDFKFQLRSARDLENLSAAEFIGPDGTNSTFYTQWGYISDHHRGNNWLQYKVMLQGGGNYTPVLEEVRFDAMVSPLTLTRIDVTPPDAFITADDAVDFNATGYDQFGLEMAFNPLWSATGGLINPSTGEYSPRDAGDFTVYARAAGKEGVANVTVDPGALTLIEVTPDIWFGSTDEDKDFDALGRDQWGNEVVFTPVWAVGGPGGSIDAQGNFTPRRPGTWKIYANDSASGISGNATANVWAGEPYSIVIEPASATVRAGEFRIFTAMVVDRADNRLEIPVEWKASGGGKVSSLGNFTATTSGQWSVYANLTLYGLSAEAIVTVTPGPLYDISMTPEDPVMMAGETLTIKATPVDEYGNQVSVSVSWAITGNSPEFSNGVFSPTVSGIYNVYANASGMSSVTVVTVNPSWLYQITVDREAIEIESGNGTLFYAQAEDQYGNAIRNVTLVWSVSDPLLGFIDQNGGFLAGSETLNGTITISATQGDRTATKTINVLVIGPKPPKEAEDPVYYLYLEIIILIMLVLVAALVAAELMSKG